MWDCGRYMAVSSILDWNNTLAAIIEAKWTCSASPFLLSKFTDAWSKHMKMHTKQMSNIPCICRIQQWGFCQTNRGFARHFSQYMAICNYHGNQNPYYLHIKVHTIPTLQLFPSSGWCRTYWLLVLYNIMLTASVYVYLILQNKIFVFGCFITAVLLTVLC